MQEVIGFSKTAKEIRQHHPLNLDSHWTHQANQIQSCISAITLERHKTDEIQTQTM